MTKVRSQSRKIMKTPSSKYARKMHADLKQPLSKNKEIALSNQFSGRQEGRSDMETDSDSEKRTDPD